MAAADHDRVKIHVVIPLPCTLSMFGRSSPSPSWGADPFCGALHFDCIKFRLIDGFPNESFAKHGLF
jgi:hypothetical protein